MFSVLREFWYAHYTDNYPVKTACPSPGLYSSVGRASELKAAWTYCRSLEPINRQDVIISPPL